MSKFFLFLFFLLIARDVSALGIAAYPDTMQFSGREQQQIIVMNPNAEQVEVSATDTVNMLSFAIASKTLKANSKTTITASPKGNGNGETEIIISFSAKAKEGMLKPAVYIPATIYEAMPATGQAVLAVQKPANPAIGIFMIIFINLIGIAAYLFIKSKDNRKECKKTKQIKNQKPNISVDNFCEEELEEKEIPLY